MCDKSRWDRGTDLHHRARRSAPVATVSIVSPPATIPHFSALAEFCSVEAVSVFESVKILSNGDNDLITITYVYVCGSRRGNRACSFGLADAGTESTDHAQ